MACPLYLIHQCHYLAYNGHSKAFNLQITLECKNFHQRNDLTFSANASQCFARGHENILNNWYFPYAGSINLISSFDYNMALYNKGSHVHLLYLEEWESDARWRNQYLENTETIVKLLYIPSL